MAKTYETIGWQDATQLKPATVVVDGTEYEVTPELMSGTTPINATNLKHMDDAIKDLYDGGASTTDIVISEEEPTTEDWKIWINPDEPINNIGSEVVDSLEGNETNKAPSVNAVNKLHTYSTEEQVVGTWINGKPIYRRTIYTTIKKDYIEGSMFYSFITVNNLEELIDAKGKMNTSAATYSRFIPNRYVDFSYNTNVNGEQKVYLEYTDSSLVGLSTKVTLEYTKSTDVATIEVASEEV